jgi:hypothetical protein
MTPPLSRVHQDRTGIVSVRRAWLAQGLIPRMIFTNRKWVKIDDRQNDTSLNNSGASSTFSISESFEAEFGMIRVRQTGKNSSGNDQLIVNAIEFFWNCERTKTLNIDFTFLRISSVVH